MGFLSFCHVSSALEHSILIIRTWNRPVPEQFGYFICCPDFPISECFWLLLLEVGRRDVAINNLRIGECLIRNPFDMESGWPVILILPVVFLNFCLLAEQSIMKESLLRLVKFSIQRMKIIPCSHSSSGTVL